MPVWKCDPTTEDLVYENNRPVLIDGAEQCLQGIRKNLKTFMGEWFLDLGYGTPWLQQVLVKNPVAADAVLKAAILKSNGVRNLLAFSFSITNGRAVVAFEVQSLFGPLAGQVEVLG